MRTLFPLIWHQRFFHDRVVQTRLEGLEHVRRAARAGYGILITPNHPGHADSYLLVEAIRKLRMRCYIMMAWQVFEMASPFARWVYRQYGCFSVYREGHDLQAYRQAVQILKEGSAPLVIFPEGDVYHLNDRVTPFREGTASIALSAVKRSERPVACIPCALRYQYLVDPTPELHDVMDRLEERLSWRPRRDLPLASRIYRLAEGIVNLKELEYLGSTFEGTLPQRIHHLADLVLGQMERYYGIDPRDSTIPERVKEVRRQAIDRRGSLAVDSPELPVVARHLDDLFFVIQLFSYPGDYVAERPTIERMAETIDKFEEDLLGLPTARIRGRRRGICTFGEPIIVTQGGGRDAARTLTEQLETRVQHLLDLGAGLVTSARVPA